MAGPVAGSRRPLLLLTLVYPIALHFTIVTGHLQAALLVLLTLATASALLPREPRRTGSRLVAAGLAVGALAGLAHQNLTALYLPPILMSALLLYLFGHSLLPGHEPLITGFARRIDGEPDERTRRYTRRLTWVWALFFAAMLLECLLLAWLAPLETWSLFTNFINYLLMLGLFLLEYLWRMVHFRRLPRPWRLVRLADPRRLREWMNG